MRAPFQAGDFPAPVKYGYASVGRVEEGPDGAAAIATCSSFIRIRRATSCPPRRCTCCRRRFRRRAPCWPPTSRRRSTALWDARAAASAIGSRWSAPARSDASWRGWRDVCPAARSSWWTSTRERAAIAEALGVRFAHARTRVGERRPGDPRQRFAGGLELALHVAGFEATVVELSWYGDQAVRVATRRRLSRAAAHAEVVAGGQRRRRPAAPRWDTRRRMQLALSLLAARRARRADHRRERLRDAARRDGRSRRRTRRRAVPSRDGYSTLYRSCTVRCATT